LPTFGLQLMPPNWAYWEWITYLFKLRMA